MNIQGNKDFIDNTGEALNLLKGLPELDFIEEHIKLIKQAESSGMDAKNKIPTSEIGNTYLEDPAWYASFLAHEAYHSYLYKEGIKKGILDDSNWVGRQAEIKCLKFQLAVIKKITKDKSLIGEVRNLLNNPGNYFEIEKDYRDW